MIESQWYTATIDIDRDPAEYSGMDVDRCSSLVDLGKNYSFLIIEVPTIDSATVGVLVQQVASTATVPKALHYVKADDSTAAFVTTAGTGAYSITVPIYGYQYIRLLTGADQTADRSFKVRGVRW